MTTRDRRLPRSMIPSKIENWKVVRYLEDGKTRWIILGPGSMQVKVITGQPQLYISRRIGKAVETRHVGPCQVSEIDQEVEALWVDKDKFTDLPHHSSLPPLKKRKAQSGPEPGAPTSSE